MQVIAAFDREEPAVGGAEIEHRRAPLRVAFGGESPSHLADAGERWWSVAQRRDPSDVLAAMTGIVASYIQQATPVTLQSFSVD